MKRKQPQEHATADNPQSAVVQPAPAREPSATSAAQLATVASAPVMPLPPNLPRPARVALSLQHAPAVLPSALPDYVGKGGQSRLVRMGVCAASRNRKPRSPCVPAGVFALTDAHRDWQSRRKGAVLLAYDMCYHTMQTTCRKNDSLREHGVINGGLIGVYGNAWRGLSACKAG